MLASRIAPEYLLHAEDDAGGEDFAGGFHRVELFRMEIRPSIREKEARPFVRIHHP
jgi:hypothetical protein